MPAGDALSGAASGMRIAPLVMTPAGRPYAYTYGRFLSTLFVSSGLK